MKVLITGPPLPDQEKLYLVRCPKCGQKVRIGERRDAGGEPDRLDRCPHCGTKIEIVLPAEMGA